MPTFNSNSLKAEHSKQILDRHLRAGRVCAVVFEPTSTSLIVTFAFPVVIVRGNLGASSGSIGRFV